MSIYKCIYIYMHVHACIHIHVYLWIYVYVCMYVYIRTEQVLADIPLLAMPGIAGDYVRKGLYWCSKNRLWQDRVLPSPLLPVLTLLALLVQKHKY